MGMKVNGNSGRWRIQGGKIDVFASIARRLFAFDRLPVFRHHGTYSADANASLLQAAADAIFHAHDVHAYFIIAPAFHATVDD